MHAHIKYIKGQTLTESVLLMPLFLMLVFALFQVGHLGIGIAIVNYAASSIARQAVAQNSYSQSDADLKFKKLLLAGLTAEDVKGKLVDSDPENVTTNLKVTACARLPAYPFVGQFLDNALHTGATPAEDACGGAAKWLGPIGLSGSAPYHFIIQGQAVVRMNYNAGRTI